MALCLVFRLPPVGKTVGRHDVCAVRAGLAALVAFFRVLDLDDVGAEHGKLIGCEPPG